jgi:hypothetical protein
MQEDETNQSGDRRMPLLPRGPSDPCNTENSPPVHPYKTEYNQVKSNQVAPIYPDDSNHQSGNPETPSDSTLDPHQSLLSPAKKKSNPRAVPIDPPSLADIDDPPSKVQKGTGMRDPSDSATERSKAFNTFFGLFFASGGLYFGYGASILAPLGEKWLKFNFGITDEAPLFLGLANLGYAVGAGLGSFVSSFLCERFGRVKLLLMSEVMMIAVHSFMWVNNIWLFLA